MAKVFFDWIRITVISILPLSFTVMADQQGRQLLQDQFAEKNRQQHEQLLQSERKWREDSENSAREYREQIQRQLKQQDETTKRIQDEAIATSKKRETEAHDAASHKAVQPDPERN